MSRLNYYYLDYLCREVGLTRSDIESVPESGSRDDACSVIADKRYVQKQLAEINDGQLFDAVKSLCDNPGLTSRKKLSCTLSGWWLSRLRKKNLPIKKQNHHARRQENDKSKASPY